MSVENLPHPRRDSTLPKVSSVELKICAAPFQTGWQTALHRPPKIRVETVPSQIDPPSVISVKIKASPPPRVRSFLFTQPQATDTQQQATEPQRNPRAQKKAVRPHAATKTRIAPPQNLIKLDDRLSYLLQPPLESLLGDGSLSLPFEPFHYQFEGIAFLFPRYAAVLADEMGLGKTMQAITALRLLFHAGDVRRALLICPKPLVTNWQREFDLWAPELPLNVIQGNQATRDWQWGRAEPAISLANYEIVSRDQHVFCDGGQAYDLVILDESQRIKNRSGKTAQVVTSIGRRRSWALTGTPIENSADDLVGIFDFVSPGLVTPNMKPRQISRAIGDYVIRRTKDQVLEDLPPKLIRDAELDLTPDQRETYRQAEEDGIVRFNSMGRGATVTHVFELILRLKQICNFDPATGESAKLERLAADLEEVAASGQKAIVFSQWVKTLEQLERHLGRFGPLQYHGKVPSRQRDGVIERFRNDPKCHVILMSYGAGGVGLNLQFSNYVFLFDRWWNPAVEDQAINRAHRIGATGPVTVSRFISIRTIEERINQILESKREIFDTIFANGEIGPAKLGMTQDEIFSLFNLVTPEGESRAAA